MPRKVGRPRRDDQHTAPVLLLTSQPGRRLSQPRGSAPSLTKKGQCRLFSGNRNAQRECCNIQHQLLMAAQGLRPSQTVLPGRDQGLGLTLAWDRSSGPETLAAFATYPSIPIIDASGANLKSRPGSRCESFERSTKRRYLLDEPAFRLVMHVTLRARTAVQRTGSHYETIRISSLTGSRLSLRQDPKPRLTADAEAAIPYNSGRVV
jgi:hypothetical protein